MNATAGPAVNDWTRDSPWIDRDDAAIDAYELRLRARSLYDLADRLRQRRDNGIVIFANVVSHPDGTRKSYVTHYSSLPDMPSWMEAPLARLPSLGVFEKKGYAFEMPYPRGRRKLPSWRQTRLFE